MTIIAKIGRTFFSAVPLVASSAARLPLVKPLVPFDWPLTAWKYSSLPVGVSLIVLPPFFQLAGQTSPNSSYETKSARGEVHKAIAADRELESLNQAQRLVD